MQESNINQEQIFQSNTIPFMLEFNPKFGERFAASKIKEIPLNEATKKRIEALNALDTERLKELMAKSTDPKKKITAKEKKELQEIQDSQNLLIENQAKQIIDSIRKFGKDFKYPVLETFGKKNNLDILKDHFKIDANNLRNKKLTLNFLIQIEYLLEFKQKDDQKFLSSLCKDIDKYGDFNCLPGIISKLQGIILTIQTNGIEGVVANIKNSLIEAFCLEFLNNNDNKQIAEDIFELDVSRAYEIHNVGMLKNTLLNSGLGVKKTEGDDFIKEIPSEKSQIFIDYINQKIFSDVSQYVLIEGITIQILSMLPEEKDVRNLPYQDIDNVMKEIFSSILEIQDESYMSSLFNIKNHTKVNKNGEQENVSEVLGYKPRIEEIIRGIVSNKLCKENIIQNNYRAITGQEGETFQIIHTRKNEVILYDVQNNKFIKDAYISLLDKALVTPKLKEKIQNSILESFSEDQEEKIESKIEEIKDKIRDTENKLGIDDLESKIAKYNKEYNANIGNIERKIKILTKKTSSNYKNDQEKILETSKEKILKTNNILKNIEQNQNKYHDLEEYLDFIKALKEDIKFNQNEKVLTEDEIETELKKFKEEDLLFKFKEKLKEDLVMRKNAILEAESEISEQKQNEYKNDLLEKIKEKAQIIPKEEDNVFKELNKQVQILRQNNELILLEKATKELEEKDNYTILKTAICDSAKKYIDTEVEKNQTISKENIALKQLIDEGVDISNFLNPYTLNLIKKTEITLDELKAIAEMRDEIKSILLAKNLLDVSVLDLKNLAKTNPIKFNALTSKDAIKAYQKGATLSDLSSRYDKEFSWLNNLLFTEKNMMPIAATIGLLPYFVIILNYSLRVLNKLSHNNGIVRGGYINPYTINNPDDPATQLVALMMVECSAPFFLTYQFPTIKDKLTSIYKKYIEAPLKSTDFSDIAKLDDNKNFYDFFDKDKSNTYKIHESNFKEYGFDKDSEGYKYLMQMPGQCINAFAKKLAICQKGNNNITKQLDQEIISTIISKAGDDERKFKDYIYAYICTETTLKDLLLKKNCFVEQNPQVIANNFSAIKQENQKIMSTLELIFKRPEETKKLEGWTEKYDKNIHQDVQNSIDKIGNELAKEILTNISKAIISQRQDIANSI